MSDSEGDNLPVETADQYVTLLNVYTCFFNHMFVRPVNTPMFSDVGEDETATNRCMEKFYEDICKLKQCRVEENKDLVECTDVDLASCTELYVLVIDNKNTYACRYVIPLIQYVASLDDWYNISWSINPVKTV